MTRLGIKVIGSEGEESLIPLLRVPSWLKLNMLSSQTLEEQLTSYLNYIDSVKSEEYSQFVGTFSEDEENDLLNLYSGNSDLYASVITDFYVSAIVREGDHKFEELSSTHSELAEEGEKFYSFVKVSEKPHREVIFEKIERFRSKGYELRLELMEKD